MNRLIAFFLLLLAVIYSYAQETASYPFDIEKSGKGSPVILIPGLASSGDVWKETVELLSATHECHVLTLAGFADQNPLDLEAGFLPQIQQGILRYIQEELAEKPILIGHSLGGFLSMSMASSSPDVLTKIIIVDSYPFYSAAMNPAATEESSKAQAQMFTKMMTNMNDSLFAAQQKMGMAGMITDPARIDEAVAWSVQSDRSTIAQAMYELMTTDLREEVEAITCPMLVLGSWYAAKDYGITQAMVQGNYEAQLAKAPNCTIKVAETAKHFIMWDEPQWFQQEVTAFLK